MNAFSYAFSPPGRQLDHAMQRLPALAPRLDLSCSDLLLSLLPSYKAAPAPKSLMAPVQLEEAGILKRELAT